MRDWADAAERLSALVGHVGMILALAAALAIGALVVVWRTLQTVQGAHTDTLTKIVGANTESQERSAAAQREASRAVGQLGDTMDRLGQSIRDTQEQQRSWVDKLIYRPPSGRRRRGDTT
jgi:uncharacterized protein HemX